MNKGEENKGAEHTLYLQNRERVRLDGVEEVVSFDDSCVVLRTALGALSLDGSELRVRKLDTEHGEVLVEGFVRGIVYVDEHQNEKRPATRGIFRLLR